MYKNYNIICLLVLASFNVFSSVLTQEEIEQFNSNSKVKITRTFDPEQIETLVVGSKMIESLTHFFGGRALMGTREGFGTEVVDPQGRILNDRELKLGYRAQYKIPGIYPKF